MSHIVLPPFCELMHRQGGKVELQDFYRVFLGKSQGQKVWIVDGAKVVRELYPSFVYGGNDQRYRFNPDGDIWLDNRIGAIELGYTLAHELIERKLMRTRGMSYDRAHLSGLQTEKAMRTADARMVAAHEEAVLEQVNAPVYRAFYRAIQGHQVWFVDGPTVRAKLDGDFCFVASDIEYDFIPKKEIWLDATMSCESVHYALVHELERRRVSRTRNREHAYECALAKQIAEYELQDDLCRRHEAGLNQVEYGNRSRGVKPVTRRRKQ